MQTLEDSEEQQLTHCKMEPNMSSSPKLETIEIVVSLIEAKIVIMLMTIVFFYSISRLQKIQSQSFKKLERMIQEVIKNVLTLVNNVGKHFY